MDTMKELTKTLLKWLCMIEDSLPDGQKGGSIGKSALVGTVWE